MNPIIPAGRPQIPLQTASELLESQFEDALNILLAVVEERDCTPEPDGETQAWRDLQDRLGEAWQRVFAAYRLGRAQ